MLKKLHGSFALGIIFQDQPDLLVGARRGSPLAVGYGPNENYLGSDSYALKTMTNKTEFEKEYSEENFWNKLTKHAKAAGLDVVEKSLLLYYAAQEEE